MTPPQSEAGYAMVAAVAGIAVFALMALTLIEAGQAQTGTIAAEAGQARASAAADAGLALALDGLLVKDRANRWSLDGRTREFRFGAARLQVRVEDERGKVPLNLLDEQTAARLMETAGLGSGERARIAADALLDWTDDDEEPRRAGAENNYYRDRGIRPRNGSLQSVDELVQIRGFDPVTVNRMRPYVTVNFGRGSFDARFAHPAAIGVMLEGGRDSPQAISRQRELDGQRTAIELGDAVDLSGRPLMIVVDASLPDGARAVRRTTIELTGSPVRPFVVRSFE